MRCAYARCDREAECRPVVVVRATIGRRRGSVRIRLPLLVCPEHSNAEALWSGVLRLMPRAVASLLRRRGVSFPRWARARIVFEPVVTQH